MANDIRLKLILDTSDAEPAVASLARRIDSSIGLATQRVEERLGRLFRVADHRLGRMLGVDGMRPPSPTSAQMLAAGMPAAAVSTVAAAETHRAQTRLQQMGLGAVQAQAGASGPGATSSTLAAVTAADAAQRARAFERLGQAAHNAGDRTRRSWVRAGSALLGLDGQIGRVRLGIVRFAATLYSLEAVGRVFRAALVDPIIASGRALVQAREEALRFQFALSGITGLPRAQLIDLELKRAVRDLPFPLADVRQSALAYSSVPGLAAQMAAASPEQAAAAALQFGTTARRLAALDPAQGNQGAIIAMREIAEGGGADAFRSIRRRFGFTQGMVARAAGVDVRELQADPSIGLAGVAKIAETLVPDEVLQREGHLITTKLAKLGDAWRQGLDRIAESGGYERVADRLEKLREQVFNYLDTEEFERVAERIGAAVERVAENAGDALARLVSRAAGQKGDASVAGVVSGVGGIVERLSAASDALPELADRLGTGLNAVAEAVAGAAEHLADLAAIMDNPSGATRGFISGWFVDKQRRLDPESRERDRLERLAPTLRAVGLPATVGERIVSYRSPERWEKPETIPGAQLRGEEIDWEGNKRPNWQIPVKAAVLEADAGAAPRMQQLLDSVAGVLDESAIPLHDASRRRTVERVLREQMPDFDSRLQAARAAAASRGEPPPDNLPIENPLPPALHRFIRDEVEPPNHGAILLSANSRLAQLSELPGLRPDDNLQNASDAGRILQGELGGGHRIAQVLQSLQGQRDEVLAQAGAARADALTLPTDDHRRGDYLKHIADIEQRTHERFRTAADLASEALLQASREYGLAVAAALAEVPGSSRMLEAIADGSSGFAQQIEEALRAAGRSVNAAAEMGVRSLPTPQAAAMTDVIRTRRLDDLQKAATLGFVQPGMAPAEIQTAFRRRPNEQQALRLQARYIQREALPDQADILSRANTDLARDPDDPVTVATAARAAHGYADLLRTLDEIDAETNAARRALVELGEAGRDALTQGLGDAIFGLLTGVSDLEDALKSMAQTFLRSFSQIAASNVVDSLFAAFQRGMAGAMGGGGGGVPQTGQGMTFPTFGPSGFTKAHEHGGIVQGWSPLGTFSAPIRAFADGGIVDRPTLGLIGEAYRPEAVVPLRGGSVPVSFLGGGQQAEPTFNFDVIVVNRAEEAALRAMASRAGQAIIIDGVSGDVTRGGRTARAIKSKAGR